MHLVLCYDVVENKRRTRLHKRLKTWLVPVQKSVFEGELDERLWPALLQTVMDEIDHDTDTVRIYRQCGICRPLCELLGTACRVPEIDDTIV